MRQIAKIREKIVFDVAIVGGGIAGLSTSIRLKQLDPKLEICVLEKALSVGDHVTSGCLFNPRALNELLPAWESMGGPITTKVQSVQNLYLTPKHSINIPGIFAPWSKYKGNYIVSLSEVCRWLAKVAEEMNVRILEGFCAKEILIHPAGYVEGVATGPVGYNKNNEKKPGFQDSVEILAKQTIFAEGPRGELSEKLIAKFKLRGLQNLEYESVPQTFALGVKEVWTNTGNIKEGTAVHTFSWPLKKNRSRGFMFATDSLVNVGYIVGLDYVNPRLDIYQEFQKFKTHPSIQKALSGGQCIEFGSRIVDDGGFFSIPKLSFPGGMIVGASAGFTNPISYQGAHTSMKSGMIAAETLHNQMQKKNISGKILSEYYQNYLKSWIFDELYQYRNFRQAFNRSAFFGLFYSAYSVKNHKEKSSIYIENSLIGENISESDNTEHQNRHKAIIYPKNDGVITFDKEISVERSKVNFKDQPEFIRLKKGAEYDAMHSFNTYGGIEEKLCPTGVFQFKESILYVDSSKCIQCGACKLKDTRNFIEWELPEAGTGPQ